MTKTRGFDSFQRLNFLYQAAHNTIEVDPKLSKFYITTFNQIVEKNVLKIDPDIKRTICKQCNQLLIPGLTSTVRVASKRQTHVVITCKECKTVKRFNTDKKKENEQETENNKMED